MSAGSCVMKKPSNVLPWSVDGGGKNDQKENDYGSFKSKLMSTADQINVNSSAIKDSDEMKNITDNDDQWRQHETQLRFVQQEHSTMLNKLHLEIENLQIKHARADVNLCTCGLNLESNAETYSELMQLRSTLEMTKQELKTVRDLSEAKDVRIGELEQRIKHLEESFEIRLKEVETTKNQSSDKRSCPADIKIKPVGDVKPKLTDVKSKVANVKPKPADVKPKLDDAKPKTAHVKPNLATVKPSSTPENPNSASAKPKTATVKPFSTTETRKSAPKPSPPVTKVAPTRSSGVSETSAFRNQAKKS